MNCKMKTFFSRFKIQKTVSNGRMFCLETPKFSTLSLLHQLLFKEKNKTQNTTNKLIQVRELQRPKHAVPFALF